VLILPDGVLERTESFSPWPRYKTFSKLSNKEAFLAAKHACNHVRELRKKEEERLTIETVTQKVTQQVLREMPRVLKDFEDHRRLEPQKDGSVAEKPSRPVQVKMQELAAKVAVPKRAHPLDRGSKVQAPVKEKKLDASASTVQSANMAGKMASKEGSPQVSPVQNAIIGDNSAQAFDANKEVKALREEMSALSKRVAQAEAMHKPRVFQIEGLTMKLPPLCSSAQ
jgi:hypothetical protein